MNAICPTTEDYMWFKVISLLLRCRRCVVYLLVLRCGVDECIHSILLVTLSRSAPQLSLLWESKSPPEWLLKSTRYRDETKRDNREYVIHSRSLALLQEDVSVACMFCTCCANGDTVISLRIVSLLLRLPL